MNPTLTVVWNVYKAAATVALIPLLVIVVVLGVTKRSLETQLQNQVAATEQQEGLKNDCVIDSLTKESIQNQLLEQNHKLETGLTNFQAAATEADRKTKRIIATSLAAKPADFQQYGCEAKLDYYFNRLGKRHETIDAK